MLVRYGLCVVSGWAVAVAAFEASAAQPFPQARPIRVISPLAAGSTVDIVARVISQNLSESLGQSVVVENIPGAGGTLGTAAAARALPDGHTLLHIPGTQVVSPALYRNPGFDIARDFAPLAIVAQAPNVIVVHPSVPVKNVGDLIALARAKPGRITYSHTGRGTPTHLFMELLKSMARVDLADVPYKTGTQSMIEVVNGQVFTSFTNLASRPALHHVRSCQSDCGKRRKALIGAARGAHRRRDRPRIRGDRVVRIPRTGRYAARDHQPAIHRNPARRAVA